MSLRTRVAIAVGVVVFGALAIVAAVVYPAVGANLRGQNDASLVRVAKEAPTIATKLKKARTPLGQLVPFGSTQLQIVPDAAAGPTDGFVGITDHDVQVAAGISARSSQPSSVWAEAAFDTGRAARTSPPGLPGNGAV